MRRTSLWVRTEARQRADRLCRSSTLSVTVKPTSTSSSACRAVTIPCSTRAAAQQAERLRRCAARPVRARSARAARIRLRVEPADAGARNHGACSQRRSASIRVPTISTTADGDFLRRVGRMDAAGNPAPRPGRAHAARTRQVGFHAARRRMLSRSRERVSASGTRPWRATPWSPRTVALPVH